MIFKIHRPGTVLTEPVTKSVFLIVVMWATIFANKGFAQDSSVSKQPQLTQLLTSYYNIKDALVAGNSTVAATSAEQFLKCANAIDYKIISEGNINVLLKDAGKISATKDIQQQRAHFSNLSANMFVLAKAVKLTAEPVYEMYCPMKKAYWLSREKDIKNPYFGSSMLTCGKVAEIIN